MKPQKIFPVALILLALAWAPTVPAAIPSVYLTASGEKALFADRFLRTELYFGTARKDGTAVTDSEWDEFLRTEVTPRIPDGFTVLAGYGQFRDSESEVVQEGSRVLIVLYPQKAKREFGQKIEEIRKAYKLAFAQESVLRVDFKHSVNVSF